MSLSDIARLMRGHQAEILRDLIDRDTVGLDRLVEQLYGNDPQGGPDDARSVVRAHLYHVRRKLKPGWRIVNVDHNGMPAMKRAGVAYRLEKVAVDPEEVFSDRRAREKERAVEEKAERERKAEEDRARRERAPIGVGNGRVLRGLDR